MKFHFNNLILWLHNGKQRVLEFKPNKVNIITGDSGTGKTAILQIIDYCFLSGKSNISESVINENVAWYGVRFNINDNQYTIARRSIYEGKESDDYYFSSIGEIPEVQPDKNSDSVTIKSVLESEFQINKNVAFSSDYGSNNIKAGSKVSFRYFLMFNTISENVITNSEGIFFDKQTESRYRDALPRIFDIATGIEKIDNILLKERKQELTRQLNSLKKKEDRLRHQASRLEKEHRDLIRQAKEYSLVNEDSTDQIASKELENAIEGVDFEVKSGNQKEHLEKKRNTLRRQIANLQKFQTEFETFKKNIGNLQDSLKPIEYLMQSDVVRTDNFTGLLDMLSSELQEIKAARSKKNPVNRQLTDEIGALKNELIQTQDRLKSFPKNQKALNNDREKYFFLGQAKSKLEIYSNKQDSPHDYIQDEISRLKQELERIVIVDTEERKNITNRLIEEHIRIFMDITESALGNYENFLPHFDYTNKALRLRKPETAFSEKPGSSSNHMFLHLFFFLSLHEIVFLNESPFVPPFLIIDQPSRPYYSEDGQRKKEDYQSDSYKLNKAIELLESFMIRRKKNGGEFQMIVFEHIPPSMFSNKEYFTLVDDIFTDGNALIPSELLTE